MILTAQCRGYGDLGRESKRLHKSHGYCDAAMVYANIEIEPFFVRKKSAHQHVDNAKKADTPSIRGRLVVSMRSVVDESFDTALLRLRSMTINAESCYRIVQS